ncbi:MAG TPA: acyclic terpene utilization AtuA family protein [Steroidobacteraceae bacterium]|nr:acyclic terpene utilization AtuA family protein [Steroidobacteraceae bacterium]
MADRTIRIGGASGYWGDAAFATPQLLRAGRVDYLVYDYLAEITMSLLARARAKNPDFGYATDFVTTAMAPHLEEIARQRVKVIANAGGMNPAACAAALRKACAAKGVRLRIAVVTGDDLMERAAEFGTRAIREMFSGAAWPAPDRIASINAYLGAFPIAAALDAGADIVVTGRCVDSAVTLGACIHEFGWRPGDLDRLAAGSLAGHLLECGTQLTGGNFTDWEQVVDTMVDAGYPIAEVGVDGRFICTKAEGTGGTVTVGTVAEQMLYEIGDPAAYVLPDVTCDFSQVRLRQLDRYRVLVEGALGHPPPATYKVCATYADGFRGGEQWVVYGRAAERKARKIAEIAFARTRAALQARGLPDFCETLVEIVGAETHYGAARDPREPREVLLKAAARHADEAGIATLFKEFVGTALAAPPGLTAFAGRPSPSPVVRLFSFLLPRSEVAVKVAVDDVPVPFSEPAAADVPVSRRESARAEEPPLPDDRGPTVTVPLETLAWARSGDKGNDANVGVIAREARYLPWLWAVLTPQRVQARFAHFLQGSVERFLLPGLPAINFVLHDVLGGGGIASLRSDPQGKGYAQLLLDEPIEIPRALLETTSA